MVSHSKTLASSFSISDNKFWRCTQPEPLPQHRVTSITQDVDSIWLHLDSRIGFGTTECCVRVHGLPGMTGQKQVQKAVSGEMKCSIKFKLQDAQQLSNMQRACRESHVYLVQETQVLHSPTLHVFEITTCNGSGCEVKEAADIKSWFAALLPADTSQNNLSPSDQHEQQHEDCSSGQLSQATSSQPSTVNTLPSMVLSRGPKVAQPEGQQPSNKRSRSCTGHDASEQVRGAVHY